VSQDPRAAIASIVRQRHGSRVTDQDLVAVEAPLEVIVSRDESGLPPVSLGLVMRTPGDDLDLVAGLLFGEQIITSASDIVRIDVAPEVASGGPAPDRPATARVSLAPHASAHLASASRALDRTSACGMCGRLAMQAVTATGSRPPDDPKLDGSVIAALPHRLRGSQAVFEETGGLHAAALCDLSGESWVVREDVGRHNAVDKVVGAALALGRLPARDSLLVVSGRVAYEIVQKAALAGVIGIVAVGAPTSLAIEAARSVGLTLVGFTRDDRFNVYTGADRLLK
jgi:FdhD protein